jgi:ribonuclease E
MKRMLFNATQAEELRVAIVDGQKLIDLDIESAAKEQRKSNIYKAVITRIEPSLEAAFVDYGAERHGFLPFKEVSRSFFKPGVDAGRARIQDALQVGQEIIVQVEKDERGNKGAALTTFISLAGRYLVLMPNNPRGGGVSRRVEGEDRQELRDVMDQLDVPQGMSLIARTAGIGRNAEELQWDLNYLMQLWRAIEGAAQSQTGAFLIYLESSLVIRAIRDYFHAEIGEILIDTDDIFEQAQHFMATVMPNNVSRIKRYRDDVPLFSRFQIEHQIESAYSRHVNLPSGGAIVIDHTEALVSVDVNSGRATKGSDIEETAFRTNCEAADEVARQLRLRDLGGLIVIDFIDMESTKNQREVENRLRDALHFDRARVQMGKISRFGLLELSRQRLRPALAETSYITCPRCTGTGHIRSTESAALHILRILEEEAMKENTGAIHAQVPVDVATFLLNEKRVDIARIEVRHRINLVIVPNRQLETPQHEIVRLRHDQLNAEDVVIPSYQMAERAAEEPYQPPSAQIEARPPKQEAAVKGITPDQPAPVVEPKVEVKPEVKAEPGIIAKIFSWFRGNKVAAEPQPEAKAEKPARRERGDRGGRDRGDRNRNRREREGREGREGKEGREPGGERKERGDNQRSQQPRREEAGQEQQPQREGRRARGEKHPREDRAAEPRQPKTPKPETAAPAIEAPIPAPAAGEGSPPQENGESGNRRRGRRGRGRERREEGAPTTEAGANVQQPAEIAAPVPMLAPLPAEPVAAWPMPWPVPMPEVKPEPVPVAPEPVVATPIDVQPAVVVEAIKQPEPAPAVAPVVVPAVDVTANLEQAGLIMIETSGTAGAVAVAETPQPTLGRKPKAAVAVAQEPLQMVETRRE